MYFDLKDDRSVIRLRQLEGAGRAHGLPPEEGMEVIATGRVTTFAPQSKYQLQVENVEPAGRRRADGDAGGAAREAGRRGAVRRRPQEADPFLPQVIGVITSPSGAVIRDILHRLRRPLSAPCDPLARGGAGRTLPRGRGRARSAASTRCPDGRRCRAPTC
jgi:exodeoxyribonuclease VII large subunit